MARNIKSRPLKNREKKKRHSFLEKSAKKERLIFPLHFFKGLNLGETEICTPFLVKSYLFCPILSYLQDTNNPLILL